MTHPDKVQARRPELTQATCDLTLTVPAFNEHGEEVPTPITGERPLTLYVDKREVVTLMTLGVAPEALIIGWLRNQRLVRSLDEIASVQVDWDVGAAVVTTRNGLENVDAKLSQKTVTSGCGQGTMFGDLMEEIDSVDLPADMRFSEQHLQSMLAEVRQYDSIYKTSGAVHGCGLMQPDDEGGCRILMFVEDVGRHNAVDAIAGQMWLDDIDGRDKAFYTTGRLTSEMVIKTAQMNIPVLVSRSGLTQMGWEIATRVGITMIGRAKGKHYLLFSGKERFVR